MRTNWTRVWDRQGTEPANGDAPFILRLLSRRVRPTQRSKAEQRRQAAAASLEWLARQKER
jgi:hypothetical protein